MGSRQLVRDNTKSGSGEDSHIDPPFAIPSLKELRLSVGNSDKDTREYLCHRIVRNPKDLRNQVRRIVLEYDMGRSEGLYGALLDLFIAMDGQGQALCKRMLEGSKYILKPSHYKLLADCLYNGLNVKELPVELDCVLGEGLIGNRELIKSDGSGSDGARGQE